jgi:hypothetical protein
VEKVLLSMLRSPDIVIRDNLSSHKRKAFRLLIRSAGAKLFLLPKLLTRAEPGRAVPRHLLRIAAARTVDAVCAAICEISEPSPQRNAPATSPIQDIDEPNFITD